MLTSVILALTPFILNSVMGIIKWLSSFRSGEQTSTKRFLLALFSLLAALVYNGLNGNPLDPNSISSLVQTVIEAFVAFIAAHGSYSLFWQSQTTVGPLPTEQA